MCDNKTYIFFKCFVHMHIFGTETLRHTYALFLSHTATCTSFLCVTLRGLLHALFPSVHVFLFRSLPVLPVMFSLSLNLSLSLGLSLPVLNVLSLSLFCLSQPVSISWSLAACFTCSLSLSSFSLNRSLFLAAF